MPILTLSILCLLSQGCIPYVPSTTNPAASSTPDAALPTPTAAGASLAVTEVYYRASEKVEDVTERIGDDVGGVVQAYLYNQGATNLQITTFRVNGESVETLMKKGALTWWRVWPETIPPGGTSSLTMHSRGSPLKRGETIRLDVSGVGFSASTTAVLEEPMLRIAYVVRADTPSSLWIFLRNDSPDRTYRIRSLGNASEALSISSASGSMALSPGALGLFHAERESPFVTLEPLHLRVVAQEASSGKDFSIGNSLRLVDPYFPIGTWGSCAWGSGSQDLLMMRSLGISSVVGSLNPPASTSPYDFGMRSLDFAGEPPDINHSKVMVRRDDGRIVAIMLKDEPEWSKKMNAADVSAAQTLVSRLTSFLPTYLNMAVSKRFSEYATMADIASMDHYAYYAPLANDLPIPHRIAEAGWYMESLKRLAEPRPTWAWTQYAGWDRDPPGWSVENQAWQVLANGAKGLYWFSYGTGFADEYPEQTAAMARVNRQLELVKGVLLRGEPYKVGVDVQGSDPLLARVVAGPDAAVIVLVNQNDRASFRLTHFSYSMGSQNVQCDIQLPNWIPTDSTVYEITSEGAVATSLRPDAGRLRFATELANTRIYLVARKSATPPVAPVAVSKIAYPDGHHYLAWPEVADRTGIDHYEILADGIQVASVRTPFWAIPDDAINRSYSVRAVDTFGNVGQISFSNQVP